jgi:hypothetical protein
MLSSFKDFQGSPGFSVGALLAQDDLFCCVLAPEVSKLLLSDFDLLPTILETITLTQFGGQKLQFPFGAARELIIRGKALSPDTITVDKANRDNTRVESHLDLGIFDRGIAHGFAPVIQMIHPRPDAGNNFRRAFTRCR